MEVEKEKIDISKIKTDEDIKKLFNYVIGICKEALQRKSVDGKIEYDEVFADLVCCSALGNLHVKCDIMPVDNGFIRHCFVVVILKVNEVNRYFILDPVYEKFFVIKEKLYKSLRIKLRRTARGRELIQQLIRYGYFEYNEIDIKLYCDGFFLSSLKKTNNNESGRTGVRYFKEVLDVCFPEMIKKQSR